MTCQFSWGDHVPAYIRRDHPNEELEEDGWFCELFVIGVHLLDDEKLCDQNDPDQWRFLVVPSRDLKRGQRSMALDKAMRRWPLISLTDLKSRVEAALRDSKGTRATCSSG